MNNIQINTVHARRASQNLWLNVERAVEKSLFIVHGQCSFFIVSPLQNRGSKAIRKQNKTRNNNSAKEGMVNFVQWQTILSGYFVLRFVAIFVQKAWSVIGKRTSPTNEHVIIQDPFRCSSTGSMHQGKKAAILIQAQWRGVHARLSYRLFLLVVIFVQSTTRQFLAKRLADRIRQERQFSATICLQRTWRRFQSWSWYRQFQATRKIQAMWRRHVHWIPYQRYKAAQTIQSVWRRMNAVRRFTLLVRITRRIQYRWRHHCQQKAATRIQAMYRGHYYSQRLLQIMSSIMIQAMMRRYLCRRHWKCHVATRMIQAYVRGFQHRLALRKELARIRIQALWRVFLVQRTLAKAKRQTHAAILIQAQWRGYLQCQNTLQLVSVILLQATMRRKLVALQCQRYKAANTIQSLYSFYQRGQALQRNRVSTTIQCAWSLEGLASEKSAFQVPTGPRIGRDHGPCVAQSWHGGTNGPTDCLSISGDKP